MLLVVDAFDECATEEEAEKILQLTLARISRISSVFRMLLTSRQESRIANVFNDYKHKNYMLHDTNEKIVVFGISPK